MACLMVDLWVEPKVYLMAAYWVDGKESMMVDWWEIMMVAWIEW